MLAVIFLFGFYLFSREIKRGFLKQTDFDTTIRLQNHIPAQLDSAWDVLALPVTPAPAVLVVSTLTVVAFFNKKIRFRALIIPLFFGLLVMGELYGKSVVHHPSPPFFMIKNPTTIFPQFYVNEQYSYPSGHTGRAIFLGLVIWFITSKRRSAILAVVIYILLVAIGRIYLGSHWLSDIIGGGLLGGAAGLATFAFL